MEKRLSTAPVWMVLLLAPVMALAQTGQYNGNAPLNQQVTHSPLSWAWVVILAVAVVAFVGYSVFIGKSRRPPNRPSVS